MSLFKKTSLLLILMGLFPAMPSYAFKCSVSVGSLNFPAYDFLSPTPTDSTTTIHVSCNIPASNPRAPLPVTISLSAGNYGNISQRKMSSGGMNYLNYNLFTNASYSSVWGDVTGISTQTNYVTVNSPWDAIVYGRIPPGQNVPAGTYSDTITVTVQW